MDEHRSAPVCWSHYNPVKVVGACVDVLDEHVPLGSRVLLVTTPGFSQRGVVGRLSTLLGGRALTVFDEVSPNPDLLFLDQAADRLRKTEPDVVIALGGGSTLDAGKALSLILPLQQEDVLRRHFRENTAIGWTRRLPLIAVPTTAGTGAEVTPFATVWDHERGRKHSIATPHAFPDLAVLDTDLTMGLSAEDTLYPGLDAVSHALESLWNRNMTPVSRAFAMQALALASVALPALEKHPEDREHRTLMQQASLLAGMAISQTRTTIAHAMSYPLTAHHQVPHGLACSFSLATLLRANIDGLSRSDSERRLLSQVLAMLEDFALEHRLASYLTRTRLHELIDQMHTPERSNNYLGVDLGDAARIIDRVYADAGAARKADQG